MKNVLRIIKYVYKNEAPKPLGRWRLENCNMQINNKIDLSNEDHCGPCGQYALTVVKPNNKENISIHLTKEQK
jgi:hypothetical protein